MDLLHVSLDSVQPNPWQPRLAHNPDHIKQLAESIKANLASRPNTHGLLQVPLARLLHYRYQLVFGHSRFAAFQLLHEQEPDNPYWEEFPVELVQYTDSQMATAAWRENADRADLNVIEEARYIQRVIKDFKWTQQQAADYLGMQRSTVANKLRLLNLPEVAQTKLATGELSERQATALLAIEKLPEAVKAQLDYGDLTERAVAMSSDEIRRATETIVKQTTHSLTDYQFTPLFPFDQPIEAAGVIHSTCKGCENFIEGKDARCTNKPCSLIKVEQWNAMQLQPAADALSLPIAPKERGYYQYEDVKEEVYNHAKEKGCEKLQIGFSRYSSGFKPFPVLPDVTAICHKNGGQCSCAMTLARAATKEKAGGMSLAKAREHYNTELLQPAGATLAEALRSGEEGAWKALAQTLFGSYHESKNYTLAQLQTAIACKVLQNDMWEPWRDLDKAKTQLTSNLKSAGLEAPWNTTALQKLESGWDVLETWYMESLKKIRTEIEFKEKQQAYYDLRAHLSACESQHLLDRTGVINWQEQIAKRAGSLYLLQSHVVKEEWKTPSPIDLSWLWITHPTDDGLFRRAVAESEPHLLRYAEILLQHVEGHRQRYDAIRIELKRRDKAKKAIPAPIPAE